jgi:hypothetical protein
MVSSAAQPPIIPTLARFALTSYGRMNGNNACTSFPHYRNMRALWRYFTKLFHPANLFSIEPHVTNTLLWIVNRVGSMLDVGINYRVRE